MALPHDPPAPDAAPGPRLVGWKAISTHLHLAIRTAQRWERDYGLPVRRIGHDRRDSVFAYPAELDAWLLSASGAKARGRHWADGNGETVDPGEGGNLPALSGSTDDAPAPRPVLLTVAAIILAIAALAGTRLLTGSGGGEEPASLRVSGQSLVVLGGDGRTLWTRAFGHLDAVTYQDVRTRSFTGIADLDGDGRSEVWMAVFAPDVGPDAAGLLLFDGRTGQRRWHYRFEGSVAFGTQRFAGPWPVHAVFVTERPEDGAGRALWIVSRDAAEFPCVLQRVDVASGRPLGTYWSAGWIDALTLRRTPSGPRLLVGSADNDLRAPALAMLDAAAITGRMPVEHDKYACRDCPPVDPLAFVAFPRPARFAAMYGAGTIYIIRAGGASPIMAEARYTDFGGQAVFRLDETLRPLHADPTDDYLYIYEQLVREGTVARFTGAPVSPDRELLPILRWERGAFVPVDLPTPASSSIASSRR